MSKKVGSFNACLNRLKKRKIISKMMINKIKLLVFALIIVIAVGLTTGRVNADVNDFVINNFRIVKFLS